MQISLPTLTLHYLSEKEMDKYFLFSYIKPNDYVMECEAVNVNVSQIVDFYQKRFKKVKLIFILCLLQKLNL